MALLGAGAGFYFLYPVELEIKDSFEVGDKHTTEVEYVFGFEITDIREEGGELIFSTSYSDEYTYAELVEYIENEVYFDEDVSEAEITEERVDTDFGKRDCIVYTITETEDDPLGDSLEFITKYYVGKNNDVLYKNLYESPQFTEKIELKRSSMIIESPSGVEIKSAEDLKVGDTLTHTIFVQETAEIAEIEPAVGNDPEKYRLRGGYEFLTRDEVIEALYLIDLDADDETDEYIGTETIKTPLGRVVCDVYLIQDSGMEGKIYVHNDIFIKLEGEFMNVYWSESDLITKVSLF